ncbi:pentatricopeptide repeat-containing protein At2g20710, mitochondrial-like isoform X2 [Camellia sinensis]|nr:pentatricopeptide repeat-containing protein At2g20710, mitochondrial-like isoform X2 [Camellia sinensis]
MNRQPISVGNITPTTVKVTANIGSTYRDINIESAAVFVALAPWHVQQQVSEWMSHKRYLDLLPGDVAIQLDLISEVHGVEQAEKYFSNIPITLRGLQVDGALLNCYAHEKSLEKAEAIMQKMTDLGFNITSLQYNVMLKLYADMGKHEKLDSHMQEMEEKGVTGNNFTFNTRLDAYAIASDIEGMEKLLMKMEADVTVDWDAYVVAANWYLRAGMVEKALPMVKKSERLVRVR